MKLWLISQGVSDGYDTYDSAVVAAETEQLAKETYPGGYFPHTYHDGSWWYIFRDDPDHEHKEDGSSWATTPEQVSCEYLGEAAQAEAGVICASFNAG